MPYKRSSRNPFLPTSGWWQPALQMWEIARDAPQVVAARTARMSGPGAPNPRADQLEFARMGWEKIYAVNEATIAATLELWKINQRVATAGMQQWWSNWLWFTSGAHAWPSRRASGRLATQSVPMVKLLAAAAPRLTAKTLAPVHGRVTKNAKRLATKHRRAGAHKKA